jgi:transitional endoplasmic reticulum ATPase
VEADSVDALRARLRRSLRHLPTATGLPRPQCYGPTGPAVAELIARLRSLPATAWSLGQEYQHNLQRNPAVQEELARMHPVLLNLAEASGRRTAMRAAAEDALLTLPPGALADWEAATILYVWAVVLRDLLTAQQLEPFSRPFAVLPLTIAADAVAPGRTETARAPETSRPAPAPPPPPRPSSARRSLPTFEDVGGLESVKAGLRQAVGDVLQHPEQAARLRVRIGGVLLYGPPGNGKSFLARATAGEFGLQLFEVSGARIVERGTGEAERSLREAFVQAEHRLPCLLFIDDIDSIAPPQNEIGRGARGALLECLQRAVETRGLVVVAATDSLEGLDRSILREGVFDFRIHVDDPDPEARRKVLQNELRGRSDLWESDVDELVRRTEGRSSGYLCSLVNRAAQHALHRVGADAEATTITRQDVDAALSDRLGVVGVRQERQLAWSDLVLPARTRERVVVLQKLVEDPDRARALGMTRIPRGAVLFGPPRTGKTSIARVLASQTSCSFFALSGSEVRSKWMGETERKIRDLFREAREARPAMVFIDEIDALAARRGGGSDSASRAHDSALNQLLTELDGFQTTEGVLVIGATNRFDLLDPAIVAGGRLSEHIEVPLPDRADRLRLLQLYTRNAPLDPSVDLADFATRTEGMAGGDIESLCTRAEMNAFGHEAAAVSRQDFQQALGEEP